jgi:antitoxin component YwqK of YwqJK toxin-antitoxin module
MRKAFAIQVILLLHAPLCFSQKNTGNTYNASQVIDSSYGIIAYNSLIGVLGGDSVRYNQDKLPLQGLVIDYYDNGQMLHKGTYSNGKLVSFINYYPSGKKERMFVQPSVSLASLKVYYENAKLRCEVEYRNGNAIKWTDYYSSGQVEFYEEYSTDMVHLVARRSFGENSFPETDLEMVDKKKKKYEQKEFFENGRIHTWGELMFFTGDNDIRKDGLWRTYNKDGGLVLEELYVKGEVTEKKDSITLSGQPITQNTKKPKKDKPKNEKQPEPKNDKTRNDPPPGPKLPDEFNYADGNKDGKITASEVSSAINLYFDDDLGKLTAQGITKLIDYYFDQ